MKVKTVARILVLLAICLVPLLLYAETQAAKGINDISEKDVQKIVSEQMGRTGKILYVDKRGVNIDDVTYFFTKDTRCYSVNGKPISTKELKQGNVIRYLLDSPSEMGIIIKLR